jgi:hypothetical protein
VIFEEAADDADVGVLGAAAEVLGAHDVAAFIEEGIEGHGQFCGGERAAEEKRKSS